MGRIVVTGSVAYDTIMVFPGRFREHILPDQTHMLNVSFGVAELERRRGGTAGNVAYTLALLGERPVLFEAVGYDFEADRAELESLGVDTSAMTIRSDVQTAACYINTDLDDNQIAAFFVGAGASTHEMDLRGVPDVGTVIIGPTDPRAMAIHLRQAAELQARVVYAPAQQIPVISDDELREGLDSAWLVIGNDYEIEMMRRRTGRSTESLCANAILVTTRGAEGSRAHEGATTVDVPALVAENAVDPTGAGDAYLAGLVSALSSGRSVEEAMRVGTLAGRYAVEQKGTQSHRFTREVFDARYAEFYRSAPITRPAAPAAQ